MSELIALTSKSVSVGSTYLDWNDNYVKSTGAIFQNHADGTRFNGQVSYSVQKINQAKEVNSKYYRRFDQMQATIDQGSVSKDGAEGNEIHFIDINKNNSAVVSCFKYNPDNKLNESQCFNYQSNILTSRTQTMHNSIGQITKSQKFNIYDKLVESNVFSYKKDIIGNDLIIIQKEKYSGNKVVSTTHKKLYDSSGKIIKIDVYDKNDKQLERNEFSYFNSGNKCQTVKSTFNISGNLNHQEKIIYNKNGDLLAMIQSDYNNGKYLTDSKLTYYTEGRVSRVIENEYSKGGKVILNKIEKIYNINNAKLVENISSSYSNNGELEKEIERKFDVNGQMNEHITRHYSDGINLTRHITRSFTAGKMTGGVEKTFDNNGDVSRIVRRNSVGLIFDEPINADTSFKGVTQLADAINTFPTREQAPAPVDTIIGSHANLGLRNLVPVMNYASRQ
ncbi:TPA: hypothetical protein U5D84_003254 [Yersinia enterocolitica]|nr:hypothetical protein [Yersinia enterocolitica]